MPLSSSMSQEMSTANASFAFDLYQLVRATDGNVFFSPYSVSTAFGILYAGTAGDTRRQIGAVFHFPSQDNRIHGGLQELDRGLSARADSGGYELRIANAVWPDARFEVGKKFLSINRRFYDARVERLDFVASADPSREVINRWTADRTNDRIPELLGPGSVTADTRLVLTNAIYFKGVWETPFEEDDTEDGAFYADGSAEVTTPFMRLTARFDYAEIDGAQIVVLPYGGGDLAMVVLLPGARDGIGALERALSRAAFESYVGAARPVEVDLSLPKFQMRTEYQFNSALAALGMPDAFDGQRANFTGMAPGGGLFISSVVHKAFVEVGEEGTEAAAATGIVVGVTAIMPARTKVFRADHPFVFAIFDRRTQSVLFLGRLADPTA